MADFTVLLKHKNTVEVIEHAFYREARLCLINAVAEDKHVKAYIYTRGLRQWNRYKPKKPFDGGLHTHLRVVAPEFLPPEAAFIHI